MAGIGGHERPNRGETDVWLTPLEIVRSLGKFDLDPCAFPGHQTAETLYTENGLEREWFGRIWLNPPYSEVGVWLRRLVQHGNGVALVFARTDTAWAQEIIPKASQVFFLRGRIKFINPSRTGATGNFL